MHSVKSLEEQQLELAAEFKEIKNCIEMCKVVFNILSKSPEKNVKLLLETYEWFMRFDRELDRIGAENDRIAEKYKSLNK